jgi:glycosyltransferase involved in cell wall biosynthesis
MRYLRRERPDMLLAAGHWANFTAICAHRWARSRARLVVSQRSHLSRRAEEHPRYLRLARRLYPRADRVIAVSGDVRDDLVAAAGVSPQRIAVVHNPVVDDDVERRAAEPLADSWLAPGEPPVVLGVGRLVAQKDFPTLIRAFAHVRARRTARLCILGDGPARASLATLARELGIADDVALPGFVPNPLPYMARAAVFVLSSAWEGLPGALIEAMACGCPVVSTRCPGGAAEILDGGRYGPLVPVGDDGALAEAIVTTLATRPDARALRLRASDFSKERAVARYMDVLFGASVGLSG